MPLIPITCFQCSDCNRIYEIDPEKCICERTVFVKNTQHGSFIILGKGEAPASYIVKCIPCGSTKELAQNNIRRQHSCGCKPRSVTFIEISEHKIMYSCKKCNKSFVVVPPIVAYCCEDSDEFGV